MPVTMGDHPPYLEELRLGGGYGSGPDGGADLDRAGNVQTNGDIACDGHADVGGDLNVGGDFHLEGLDTGWRTYLPASLAVPDPSLPSGPVSVTNWRNFQVVTPSVAFDPDNPQAAFFQFRLPNAYDGRPLKFTLEWSATEGTTGDVRWGVNPLAFNDSESLIKIGDLNYSLDSFFGTSHLHEVSVMVDSLTESGGRFVTVRIMRDAGNVLDTFDNSALLLGLAIEF